jgi:hypothetical protein
MGGVEIKEKRYRIEKERVEIALSPDIFLASDVSALSTSWSNMTLKN